MQKSVFIPVIVILCLTSAVLADDYQMVRVNLRSSADLENLLRLGIDLEGSQYKKDTFIDVAVSLEEKRLIEHSGFRTEILIEDLERFYESRLETRVGEGFGYGSMGGYYTFSEVLANLDSMIFQYPQLISHKDTVGYSILGKPIVAVKISDFPNTQENEPEVLFTGLHHSREPAGMMAVLYYMWYLLENYGTDPQATFLVDNRQMWFIPVVNPDGYVRNQQTNPNGGGMWRKNARDNNDNGIYFESGIDGVDLNRNYGYQWGYNNIGSSPNPGSDTYRGPFAFSEVEAQSIRNFCNQHQFMSAFNYHTYSNLLIHPWAYNDQPTPDHRYFYTFGVDMTRFNRYTLGTPSQTVSYTVNGDTDDWMYGEQTTKPKMLAYTPEVGTISDGFWPPTNRILPLAQENLYPNLVLSYVAGSYPRLAGTEVLAYGYNRNIDPGDVVDVLPSLTNYGLQTSGPVSLQLLPQGNDVVMINDLVTFPPLNSLDTLQAVLPWQFQVNYSIPVGSRIILRILISESGNFVNSDSLSFVVGTPVTQFTADAESGLPPLATGGSGGTWGITSSASHSPTRSYTDSPSGSYTSNADYWLRTPALNLLTARQAFLSYWTRWDIEDSWDFGIVEISTNNGTSWTHLVGQHMNPASGSGRQTPGLSGYDGTQTSWVAEQIDLSPYTGHQIQIRFRLMTDGSVTRDGWYVDDILLQVIDSNANIPPYISSDTPLGSQTFTGNPYPVQAVIRDDRGIDHATLFYSVDNGQTFSQIAMTGTDSLFQGNIPPLSPGIAVQYYLQAWDTSGAYGIYPFNAPAGALSFTILHSGPVLVVDPVRLDYTLPQLASGAQALKLYNPGTDPVNYQITDTTVQMERQQSSPQIPDDHRRNILDLLRTKINELQGSTTATAPESMVAGHTEVMSPVIVISDSLGDTNFPGMDILSVDFSESLFSYSLAITFAGPPDTAAIGFVSVDVDQNFATGAYPPPFGFGLGNHDVGAEYDILFDFANLFGDTAGLPPSAYVFDVSDSNLTLVGLPMPLQINGNVATITLVKLLFPIFDPGMNLSATMIPLGAQGLPDMAPDFGHGNRGGELGCSWIAALDAAGTSYYPLSGTIAAGDSARITIRVAAAYPTGDYHGQLRIANNGMVPLLEVPVQMTIELPGFPQIAVDPQAIADTLQTTSGVQIYPVSLSNSGNGTLYYTISDSFHTGSGWMVVDPLLGVIPPGEIADISVSIDPAGLFSDTLYQAEIFIYSNDPNYPEVSIPVSIFIESPVQILVDDQKPVTLALHANFPNPFNPGTIISFDLPAGGMVTLEIFNLLGQKVSTVVSEQLTPGQYRYEWSARNESGQQLSAGIYFYRLQAGGQSLVRKMILTR